MWSKYENTRSILCLQNEGHSEKYHQLSVGQIDGRGLQSLETRRQYQNGIATEVMWCAWF